MIKILNKTGQIIAEFAVENLSYANLRYANLRDANLRDADLRGADLSGADLSYADLRDANLRYANLRDANLRDADLRDADLRYANLSGANLRDAEIIIITWSAWTVCITNGHIRIGCQSHKLEDWINFSDTEISEMDSKALDFWKENKELIVGLCKRFEIKKS